MTNEPVAELHPDYSSAGARATPWHAVVALLEQAEIFWLSTVRADNRPHVTPLPAMWLDGALHFSTGLEEQEGGNLSTKPALHSHHREQLVSGRSRRHRRGAGRARHRANEAGTPRRSGG
ncbi:pyridoxamine 5'-phosphate oxidase family protein [Actinopolyspora lacussalsi]